MCASHKFLGQELAVRKSIGRIAIGLRGVALKERTYVYQKWELCNVKEQVAATSTASGMRFSPNAHARTPEALASEEYHEFPDSGSKTDNFTCISH